MGLNIYGYVNNSGIGTHTKYFTSALSNYYPNITLVPCDWNLDMSPEESQVLTPLIKNIDSIDLNDPYIILNMPHYMLYGSGNPRIGYPVFETSELKPSQINVLKQMNYLFVTSAWAKMTAMKNLAAVDYSGDRIFVIPEGVDMTMFNREVKRHKFYLDDDKFTFLSVGKFEMRKSPQEILTAFTETFRSNSNVRLMTHWWTGLMPNWIQVADKMIRELGYNRVENEPTVAIAEQPSTHRYQIPNGCEVVLNLKRFATKGELAQFYRCGDVGVYPSRGEGWNLPLIESMACGLPCIVGLWTSHTEFVTEESSFALNVDTDARKVVADDGWFFKGDMGYWYEPKVSAIADAMGTAYNDEKRRKKVAEESYKMAQKFTWDNAGEKASSILYNIFEE
ncbi:glycosyltransferase [Candidatus Babeliales bacterium]|nr:glycosyltransferase [Candidatus Babeliales bacterium]